MGEETLGVTGVKFKYLKGWLNGRNTQVSRTLRIVYDSGVEGVSLDDLVSRLDYKMEPHVLLVPCNHPNRRCGKVFVTDKITKLVKLNPEIRTYLAENNY